MYISIDAKPLVLSTGDSRKFEGRWYYYLPVPACQFVTRNFTWGDVKLHQVFDANVSDEKNFIVLQGSEIAVKKITLRRLAEEGEALKPVPLSRLLLQIMAADLNGVFVSLTSEERAKLLTISELPHEAIKSLISFA